LVGFDPVWNPKSWWIYPCLPEAWGIISKIHIQRIRDFSNFGDNALRILEGLFVAESGRFLTI